MNLLSRISELLSGDLDALLDRKVSVETAVNGILHNMETGLAHARRHAAALIAAERQIAWELARNRAASAPCSGTMRHCLGKNYTAEADELNFQLESDRKVAKLQGERAMGAVRRLEDLVRKAERRRRSIVSWLRVAVARVELHDMILRRMSHARSLGEGFEKLASTLDAIEAELKWDSADAIHLRSP